MILTGVLRFVTTTAIAAAVAIGALWIAMRAMRNARKGSHGAAAIGWVLLFLGFGIPPPPTPQQQVEDMSRERGKEKTGSDTDDDRSRLSRTDG